MSRILTLSILALSSFASVAHAETIQCLAAGNTFGIMKISAMDTDLKGQMNSTVTIQSGNTLKELAQFNSNGSAESEFQILADISKGPRGTDRVFLKQESPGKFVIETRTFCNAYYQEETCQDGDVINVVKDDRVLCAPNAK
jgi:hypothetical protein